MLLSAWLVAEAEEVEHQLVLRQAIRRTLQPLARARMGHLVQIKTLMAPPQQGQEAVEVAQVIAQAVVHITEEKAQTGR